MSRITCGKERGGDALTIVIQQNVVWLHVSEEREVPGECTPTHTHTHAIPVGYPGLVQVGQATGYLCSIEDAALLTQAWVTNVVYVEAQIPTSHERQNHAQRVFGLVGIGQIHLQGGRGGGGEGGRGGGGLSVRDWRYTKRQSSPQICWTLSPGPASR